ncbi:NAD(P)-binding protein [Exidia glandulosa HHB12029]|uniref:NAD(P)-binding protein n=1 Tax=Exidia glandulosa HHB12029 TaxID=1314781 RepID=A0A165MSC5_EXIGL|nr:NAD(P)-binding protein [Exidia glandulosa HHB12029]
MASQLVWVITGTSSGIGRELAIMALKRGDKVVATGRARSLAKVAELKAYGADILELDVTSPLEELRTIAENAVALYGRVDVVVNNAGSFIAVGALEEISPKETLAQFNVGLFGALNIARAFLPYLRAQRCGQIIWIGSLTGWVGGPLCGMYAAVKHAMRGLSESLDDEIAPFGVRSICIEPGFFRTELIADGNRAPYESRIADYRERFLAVNDVFLGLSGKQPGDTVKLCALIVDIVKGEGFATGRRIPRTIQIGNDCYHSVKTALSTSLATLEEWKPVIITTDISQPKDDADDRAVM